LSATPLERQRILKTINFELLVNLKYEVTVLFILLLNP